MDMDLVFSWFAIPVVSLIGALIMIKFPPKDPNSFVGYRTRRSSQSMTAWNFAQHICGKAFLLAAVIMLVPTIVVAILTATDVIKVNTTIWLTIAQAIILFVTIPYTEYRLKKQFGN